MDGISVLSRAATLFLLVDAIRFPSQIDLQAKFDALDASSEAATARVDVVAAGYKETVGLNRPSTPDNGRCISKNRSILLHANVPCSTPINRMSSSSPTCIADHGESVRSVHRVSPFSAATLTPTPQFEDHSWVQTPPAVPLHGPSPTRPLPPPYVPQFESACSLPISARDGGGHDDVAGPRPQGQDVARCGAAAAAGGQDGADDNIQHAPTPIPQLFHRQPNSDVGTATSGGVIEEEGGEKASVKAKVPGRETSLQRETNRTLLGDTDDIKGTVSREYTHQLGSGYMQQCTKDRVPEIVLVNAHCHYRADPNNDKGANASVQLGCNVVVVASVTHNDDAMARNDPQRHHYFSQHRRHHTLLPYDRPLVVVDEPSTNDVLLGKGKSYQNHPGNVAFRGLVETYRRRYDHATRKAVKTQITTDLVGLIQVAKGGKFLERFKSNDDGIAGWVEVDDRRAREKVALCFRSKRRQAYIDPDDTLSPLVPAMHSDQEDSPSCPAMTDTKLHYNCSANENSSPRMLSRNKLGANHTHKDIDIDARTANSNRNNGVTQSAKIQGTYFHMGQHHCLGGTKTTGMEAITSVILSNSQGAAVSHATDEAPPHGSSPRTVLTTSVCPGLWPLLSLDSNESGGCGKKKRNVTHGGINGDNIHRDANNSSWMSPTKRRKVRSALHRSPTSAGTEVNTAGRRKISEAKTFVPVASC